MIKSVDTESLLGIKAQDDLFGIQWYQLLAKNQIYF